MRIKDGVEHCCGEQGGRRALYSIDPGIRTRLDSGGQRG